LRKAFVDKNEVSWAKIILPEYRGHSPSLMIGLNDPNIKKFVIVQHI
jgi:hypothetical protein